MVCQQKRDLKTDQQHSTRCAIRKLPNRKAVDEGNCRSDETSVYWMSPARLRRADIFLTNAGEVGDGPDQGHSGGADSVPPAPNSLSWRSVGGATDGSPAIKQRRSKKNGPALRAYILAKQVYSLAFESRIALAL